MWKGGTVLPVGRAHKERSTKSLQISCNCVTAEKVHTRKGAVRWKCHTEPQRVWCKHLALSQTLLQLHVIHTGQDLLSKSEQVVPGLCRLYVHESSPWSRACAAAGKTATAACLLSGSVATGHSFAAKNNNQKQRSSAPNNWENLLKKSYPLTEQQAI